MENKEMIIKMSGIVNVQQNNSYSTLSILEYSKKTKLKIKKERFALNKTQRLELLSKIKNPKHRLFVRMQLECGFRAKELCNLALYMIRWIPEDEPKIRLEAHEGTRYLEEYSPKTYSSNRTIPISLDIAVKIKEIVGKRKRGYVFTSQKTQSKLRVDSMIKMINKYSNMCESIPIRIDGQGNLTKNIGSHCLRRTFASYLAQKGVPIGKISKLLGHSDIRTTFIYLYQIDDENFDNERNILSDMNTEE